MEIENAEKCTAPEHSGLCPCASCVEREIDVLYTDHGGES